MQIKPRNDGVLIRVNVEAEKLSFLLPDNMEKEEKAQGTVEAVGPKVTDLEAGKDVLFGKFAGDDLEINGVKYKLIKQEDVLALVEKE